MNLMEYIEKFGNETFEERELNEVDSLIFSELAYLNYTGIVKSGKPEKSFGELCDLYDTLVTDTLLPTSNRRLLDAVKESGRFKDVRPGFFSELNDEEKEVRFAAVTYNIGQDLHYVAFRGTDITILGWKEDFNMAFSRKIPSQGLAVEYLADVAGRIKGDIIVGGHSKGGNLAVYASVNSHKKIRKRIAAVYNHDGPGFHDEIFDTAAYEELENRIFKTLPHDSLIGILLHHTNEYKVVVSKSVLIGQHNPFAWDVKDEKSFSELPETTKNSRRNDKILREFVLGMSEENRKKFVEALFTVIGGSGAKTVFDFKKRFFKKIEGIKEAYKSLSDDEQLMLKKNGVKLVKIWFNAMKRQSREEEKSGKK